MGAAFACFSQRSPEKERSDLIDDVLQEDRLEDLLNFRLLMLGAGESGKSTVMKQLCRIYDIRDTELLDCEVFTPIIHTNTVHAMNVLIEACETFGTPLSREMRREVAHLKGYQSNTLMNAAQGSAIYRLWRDQTIRNVYHRRHQFYFPDSGNYYFNSVRRFMEPGFKATPEDIVMARVRTTGILENEFRDPPILWNVVDVGGQRSERKKWIRLFDGIQGLLFLVNLAGYNSVLYEDESKNRMIEAIELFEKTMSTPTFFDIPVFLFLNKMDVFEEFLEMQNITSCFKDYQGPPDKYHTTEYIKSRFQALLPAGKKFSVICTLSSKDINDVDKCFRQIFDCVLELNKRRITTALEISNRPVKRG
eukprot:242941_1